MNLPKFEDVHPAFPGPNTYRVTNEEPELHSILLKPHHHLRKVAGIASGGEVPLAVLLPKCRRLDLVDHSYGSLAWAFLKTIMLAQSGPRRMKALLCEESFENFLGALKEAERLLPEPLRAKINLVSDISGSDQTSWRKEWFHVPEQALLRAHAKLHLVTFIHGDISDLKDRGPYDCFYFSNAHEHTNRTGKHPKGDVFRPLLRDGGLMLGTSTTTSSGFPMGEWEILQTIKGVRTSWGHQLLRKRPPFSPTATLSGSIA